MQTKETIEKLAKYLLDIQQKSPEQQLFLGVAGYPGSGKSTIAMQIVQQVNAISSDENCGVILPMDGFHFYRAELDAMEDAATAYKYRGAPWTFNAEKFVSSIQLLKECATVSVPSFDHHIGDPVENDIIISNKNKIILIEGNYLYLNDLPWKHIPAMLDECWFVDVDIDIAMQRVVKRHISTGLSVQQALKRVKDSDNINAKLIKKHLYDDKQAATIHRFITN